MLSRLQSPGSFRIFYHMMLFFCEFPGTPQHCSVTKPKPREINNRSNVHPGQRTEIWLGVQTSSIISGCREVSSVLNLELALGPKPGSVPHQMGEYWSSGLDSATGFICVGEINRYLSHRDNTRFLQGLKLSCVLHGVYYLQRGERKLILERQKIRQYNSLWYIKTKSCSTKL